MRLTYTGYYFLLYVSMMLIITFLQQEFVLLPELQNLDIVGEDAKAQLLERYQRMRWVSFLLVPILLALRLSLVSLSLFIGSFFFTETNGKKLKDWWGVATIAQAVMLSYSVILCIVNIALGAATMAKDVTTYTSLLFLGSALILCTLTSCSKTDVPLIRSGNPDIFVIPSNERPRPIAETYYFDGSKV